jgi:hypothetical protein
MIEEADPINSWEDVAGRLKHFVTGGKDSDWWLFRGVTNADRHDLVPSVGRKSARIGDRRYTLEDEKSLLAAFKAEARPYLNYTPQSDIEWLSIAQHYGVPTRLLDWTESFLVALFFAVKDGGLEGAVDSKTGERLFRPVNAAIYFVRNPPYCDDKDCQRPFEVTTAKAYVPPHISPQIPAQRSVFTIHQNPAAEPNLRVRKAIVAQKACMQIKTILDRQAINHGSLFPHLSGLSAQLSWRYKWGRLHAYRSSQ